MMHDLVVYKLLFLHVSVEFLFDMKLIKNFVFFRNILVTYIIMEVLVLILSVPKCPIDT